jgi:hypothetical protein
MGADEDVHAVDLEQPQPLDRAPQVGGTDGIVATPRIEALRRQRNPPCLGKGYVRSQERPSETVAMNARRSASIRSGSSQAAKWPPLGMSVQWTML